MNITTTHKTKTNNTLDIKNEIKATHKNAAWKHSIFKSGNPNTLNIPTQIPADYFAINDKLIWY